MIGQSLSGSDMTRIRLIKEVFIIAGFSEILKFKKFAFKIFPDCSKKKIIKQKTTTDNTVDQSHRPKSFEIFI